jgi:ABC-type multidrug transport system fused ATPase/permease subunit
MTRPSRRRREAEAWGVLRLAAREHRWLAGAHVAASLTAGLLESVILVLVAQVAARLVEGGTHVVVDAGPIHMRTTVGVVLAVAGACAAARVGLQVAVAYLPARIAADVQARLRGGLFDEFDRSSWSVQAEERDGHLQELVTSHVVQATQGLMQAGVLVTSALGFLALLISAMFLSVPVALTVIGVAWLLSLALRPLSRRGRRHAHELSTTSLAFAGGISEAVRVAEEAQVFGVSEAQQQRVRDLVTADRSAFLKTKYTARLVQYLYQGLAIAVIVTGLAGLYWSGTGRIAVLGAVVLMLVRSASYGQQAYASYLMVVQTVPFLDRLSSAEARYRAAAAPVGHRRLDHVRRIACDRVHYAYARGADALADVSFDVVAGESVGIVGPSGAGKSTLVQILLRLREPTTGRYLVNGETGSEIVRDDWCRLVACVPQDPRVVHGSVRDNIRFFRAIGDEAVERAARLAHIHDDVLSWPGGYDAVIGQRADAVSGGQRQRICLARALAGEPEVLVLDEPTSALDLRSESLVQDSLVALRGRVTLFVVSHRLSMLAVCDRVIVLSNGRIEALEPTALLRRRSAFYQGAVALAARDGR